MNAKSDSETLEERAREVLTKNNLGSSTKPAPDLYPHQWNWDSCFIAVGISRYDEARAQLEIRSLLKGQWRNGMIPQIIFNPSATGYFPGPDVWQSERSPDAPTGIATSGITQPPVVATAALAIYRNAGNKASARTFLEEVYPAINRYHEWFYAQRDPDGNGLITVVHPWESGLDNSPPYLDAGTRVHLAYKPHYERLDLLHVAAKNRPTNKDYDLFVYLLELMRAVNWDQERYLPTAPLQVEDVLFNAVLCRANLDLAEIAEIIGEDASPARRRHARTSQAINSKLWDDSKQTYFSFDRVSRSLLRDDTISAFITLFGRVASPERAAALVEKHLLDPQAFWPLEGTPVPTTAASSPWFNPENYWLGPVWVNTNWMIADGLQAYGYDRESQTLRTATIDLVRKGGFREYYHPVTQDGYGTDSFSWTAALTIDLLADE